MRSIFAGIEQRRKLVPEQMGALERETSASEGAVAPASR